MSDKFTGFDLGPAPEPKPDFKGFDLGPVGGEAPSEPTTGTPRGLLDNAPDDNMLSSTAKGVGTALIKGVSAIPGMVGDLREGGRYLARRAIGAFTGETPEQLASKRAALKRRADDSVVSKALSVIPSTDIMPTSRDVAASVLNRTGEYTPQSRWGKYAMLALEAVPAAFSPVKLAGQAPTMATAREALKTTTKAAPLLATAAPAADVATEFTGDPLAGIAAGLAAPAVVSAGASKIRDMSPAVRAEGKQAAADKLLAEAATDPRAAIEAVGNRRPGDVGTLAEVTGDKGLAISEHRANSLDDAFRSGQADIRAQQNTNRINVLNALQPDGDPRSVSRAFDQHLDDITQTYDRAIASAEARAQQLSGDIPTQRPEDLGARQRDVLQHYMDEANAARRALYDAVDPDGTLVIVTQPFATRAQEIINSHPPTAPELSGRTRDPFAKAVELGPQTSYRDLRGLDENITGAMKKARVDGLDNELRLLTELKSAIKQSMNDAVDNQVAWEARAVQRGAMPEDATLRARLQEQVDAFYRARDANPAFAQATGTGPSVGAPASGAPRPDVGGSGNAPGGARVQDELTPFDAAARERLNAANTAHREYVEQYKMGAPGKILETTGYRGSPKIYDTAVVDKAFPPGAGGYETAGHVMQGSGPDGPAIMQQMALQKLRESMNRDGLLDQRGLDVWRDRYSGALRAIDEVTPGWSRQFDNVAQATEAIQTVEAARKAALGEYEKSVAKNFLGLTAEDDVVANVGQIMNSRNSGTRSAELVAAMAGNPDAIAGLRRAGVEAMLRDFSTGGAREGARVLSGPRMLSYFAEHQDALRNVYGADGLSTMRALADDVMRSQQATTAAATAGSDTAAKLHKFMKDASEANARVSSINSMLGFGAWDALSSLSMTKAAMVGSMKVVNNFVEQLRSRGIRDINDLVVQGMLNPEVGKAMLQRAVDRQGAPNVIGFARVLGALDAVKNEDRPQRASGGRIGALDHAAEAARYVRLASRIKNAHSEKTKEFLNVPDATVAKALAVAHEAI